MRISIRPIACAACLAAHAAVHASEITFEARDFDDGNVRVSLAGQQYADGPSCIWHKDGTQDQVEYVLELPVTGDFTLFGLYTAQQSRPVDICVDGRKIHTGFAGVTGSWNTQSAKWEKQCAFTLTNGPHTLTLQRLGAFPHICALRLQSSVPFPEGWQPKRLTPEQRAARARERAQRDKAQAQTAALKRIDPESVRRAIDDLEKRFPDRYAGALHRQALATFERERTLLLKGIDEGKDVETSAVDAALAGVRSALLANPLLDFDRLLVVKRAPEGSTGFVPANYLTHAALAREGWDNEISVLSNLRGRPKIERLYKPQSSQILRDVRLDTTADRLLFSSIDASKRWAVFQINTDGTGLEQLTPTNYPDVDFFDACYLPSGKIVLCSTANYVGLPCLSGQQKIASLYLYDPLTKALRQLTFDQDSDNDPTVLNDGRVLFQRWEYSDIPHYFSRRRMSMNPDGTGQLALYGSNSWFPTAFRFAKAVPGHPTLLAGIISGHHDYGDCGRLALLDPALASAYPFRYRPTSKEWGIEGQPIAVTPEILPACQTGFVQLIPGWGKPVAGTVCDAIITHHYLKELPALTTHPCPLDSKYFLVSMKPSPQSQWGIYLVDVFDNATLIAEVEGAALFEPQPLAARPKPPVIPERVALEKQTADVHIADIYSGPGLQGVPRGTVKKLRLFAYHFGYLNKAGFTLTGIQSGWDVKRILGTATVEADGSACFQIPANTPVSIQPLDGEGRAVQLMRSWLVGMPGERVSCAGCHENRMSSLPPQRSIAEGRRSQALTPWYGPPRPFAFATEVFPVLERHCIGCHDKPPTVGPRSKPCFKDPDTAYNTLHPYVHRSGVESDMALLTPMEYHASTSLLIQMLEKGHHGVKLADMGQEARERLTCWIDLNVPRIGSWNPPNVQNGDQRQRRLELAKAFANLDADPEGEFEAARSSLQKQPPVAYVAPPPETPAAPDGLKAQGFPMTPAEARQRQSALANSTPKPLELGNGVTMEFAPIPKGEFAMGSLDGAPDERPRSVVRITKPFRMTIKEVTNAQYAQFDPEHDTRYVDMHYMNHVVPGFIANHPDQPVARVSWSEAMRFCEWLSRKTGLAAALPTEAQWEWAARAGTDTPFFYGTLDTDFSRFANLADQSLRWFQMKWEGASVMGRRYPYPPEMNFPLHDERFRDNWHVVDYAGQTEPNAWGLKDMVGNVSEWTRSDYSPYPYAEDARNSGSLSARKVARGGSWADRPADAGSSVRRAYPPWQKVHDVGFRIVIEEP